MKNPFKFGKEVSGYQFYDRKPDADSLRRKLADGSTNVVLFAPRRYGKTSLVMRVLERLAVEDGINGICFDMMRIPDVGRFCEEYANAVYGLFGGRRELLHKLGDYLAHLHPTVTLSGSGMPSITFDYGSRMTATSLAEILDLPERLAADAGGRPVVVAFDEFQEVAEMSKDLPLEKIFRSSIQAHRLVRYVFLGSKTHMMKRMFGDSTRPFYNSAFPMPLGKPPADESMEFLASRFGEAGISLSSSAAQAIVAASENIPYYLQAVASLTFEAVSSAGRGDVSEADIASAVGTLVGVNSELYDERLRNMSNAKRNVVDALAAEPTSVFDERYRERHSLPVSSTLHTALKELVDDGVVESVAGEYRLSDPMFANYISQAAARIFTSGSQSHETSGGHVVQACTLP
jgi:hypothetical protein